MASFLLLEDDVSKILLEDDVSFLLMEGDAEGGYPGPLPAIGLLLAPGVPPPTTSFLPMRSSWSRIAPLLRF